MVNSHQEYDIPSDTWRAMESDINSIPIIGFGGVLDSGPHIVVFTSIFVGPLVLATIPRRPRPDGCTHAAIISPIRTMNC